LQKVSLQEKQEKELAQAHSRRDAELQRHKQKFTKVQEDLACCRAETASVYKSLEQEKLRIENLNEQVGIAKEDLKRSRAAQSRLRVWLHNECYHLVGSKHTVIAYAYSTSILR
jgi:chromosome segregation ATPase